MEDRVIDDERSRAGEIGKVSRNLRFFRHRPLSGLRCIRWPDGYLFNPDSTVIAVKNFPIFVLMMESFAEKFVGKGFRGIFGVPAYTPRFEVLQRIFDPKMARKG